MRLAPTILLPALALAAAAVARPQAPTRPDPPPENQTFCEKGIALCDIAESWDDCSELYVASMKA